MTLRILTFALLLGLGFASCKNDSAATSDTPAATESGMEGIAPQPGATTGAVSNPNPPHGEPGHRCDIPVGASLDTPLSEGYTPPSNANAPAPVQANPQGTSSPVFNTQQSAPQPVVPAATTGVKNPNPPHGEPGHRCDIPVGASLDGQ
jgi:hypothetical protein